MRLRTEIDPSGEEEIILRCKRLDEKTSAIYRYIESALSGGSEMELTLGDREFFVPQSERPKTARPSRIPPRQCFIRNISCASSKRFSPQHLSAFPNPVSSTPRWFRP